jgi:hypothetical protein
MLPWELLIAVAQIKAYWLPITPAKAGVQSRAERGIEKTGFLLSQE